jgi:hypothetical protein
MYELGAFAAGATAEIIALNHGDLQASCGGIKSNTGARRTSANHQNVIFFAGASAVLEVDELLLARLHLGELGQGESAISTEDGWRDGRAFGAGDVSGSVGVVQERTTSNGDGSGRQSNAPGGAS